MDNSAQDTRKPGPAMALRRVPTGAKVFLILGGALLPLALIALFTTMQTTRIADDEARSRLRVASSESSSVLERMLSSNTSELRSALLALEQDSSNSAVCSRLAGTFASPVDGGARFAVVDARGNLLCGEPLPAAETGLKPGEVDASLADGKGLTIRVAGAKGSTATVIYSAEALAAYAKPSGFVPEYGAALVQVRQRLPLRSLPSDGPLDRRETTRYDLHLDGVELEMTMPGAPISQPLMIALLVPVLMWVAAAVIGWFVVDRLLIRPLRRLRAEVSSFRPGDVIDPAAARRAPAQEIRDLGETFNEMSRMVQLHEQDLAEGLVRQTRLTREVHHRVKNNLQVIASLINFHARGAKSREANDAYASIQRRVDALAVVHRHHYAELEENRGLELRSVIGELASNIRATAPAESAHLGITLEVEPFFVSQDVAVAVAFLLTELVELAMAVNPAAQIRITAKAGEEPNRAVLRVSSPALVESPEIEALVETRYGRVIGGLVRQLRSRLHHDPLVGAYETSIAVTGRD